MNIEKTTEEFFRDLARISFMIKCWHDHINSGFFSVSVYNDLIDHRNQLNVIIERMGKNAKNSG